MKRITKILITISILATPLFFAKETDAIQISPILSEYTMSTSERKSSEIVIKNTENKTITVTPKIYPYDPQTETLLQENGHTFLKADIETFDIKSNEFLEIKYEIIPQGNLEPGTYFNLLVLEEVAQQQVIKDSNPVNTTRNLAHLVALHITEGGVVKGIDTNFANIELVIVNKGIPFIQPTVLKYTYQNTTNYVLEPEGELQIYNIEGKYEPIYVKINKTNEKLYPGETREEEITIDQWNIRDLFMKRKVVGRFYNGIDENHLSTDITIEAYTIPVLVVLTGFILLIALLRSLFNT